MTRDRKHPVILTEKKSPRNSEKRHTRIVRQMSIVTQHKRPMYFDRTEDTKDYDENRRQPRIMTKEKPYKNRDRTEGRQE